MQKVTGGKCPSQTSHKHSVVVFWCYFQDSVFSLSSEKAGGSFGTTSPLVSLQSLTLEEVLTWAQSFEKLMSTKREYAGCVTFDSLSVSCFGEGGPGW